LKDKLNIEVEGRKLNSRLFQYLSTIKYLSINGLKQTDKDLLAKIIIVKDETTVAGSNSRKSHHSIASIPLPYIDYSKM